MDSVPGRMGFLLTLFLCTVNILNSTASNTPKSGGDATAIIRWIMWCLLFIIMAILEYAAILGYKKCKKTAKINVDDCQSHDEKVKKISRNLDKLMAIVCPSSFIIFTAVFWSHFCYWTSVITLLFWLEDVLRIPNTRHALTKLNNAWKQLKLSWQGNNGSV